MPETLAPSINEAGGWKTSSSSSLQVPFIKSNLTLTRSDIAAVDASFFVGNEEVIVGCKVTRCSADGFVVDFVEFCWMVLSVIEGGKLLS
jgi:hypothetical protein